MTRQQKIVAAIAAVALLVVGVALGVWWGDRSPKDSDTPSTATIADRQILYWYDPMAPDQHFDKPGKSPFMDMQLVPKYADGGEDAGVSIAPGVRQNLGIRTVQAERGSLEGSITVPGTVGWDLRREHVVSARVDTIIEHVFVRAPYERVNAGQALARVLAPTWSTALAEAQAVRSAESDVARSLLPAARSRVRMLGLPAGARVEDGRVVLTAPASGVVTDVVARSGATAAAGTLLFRLNGTETVWLEADVPQAEVGDIGRGTPVQARVSSLPGEVFEGRVEALLPQIQAESRTQRVRIVLDNPDGWLVPGMFAEVSLHPVDGAEHPLVPSEAVIGGGTQARVIVVTPEGRFQPVPVRLGRSADGMTQILTGLQGGEQVVASGQFLIDSEASLSGALDRLETDAMEMDEDPAP